jgi:peroxiredoxin
MGNFVRFTALNLVLIFMYIVGKFNFYLVLIFCFGLNAWSQEFIDLDGIVLKNIQQENIQVGELTDSKTVAFIFLSPECPMCIKYSLPIRNITAQFQNDSVSFILVFPGRYYSTAQIATFLKEHNLNNQTLLDEQHILTQKLNASITPQVFLVKDSKIFYSGKIDNWYQKLGKSRKQANIHYLADAINSIIKGEEISVKSTLAIGCLIN